MNEHRLSTCDRWRYNVPRRSEPAPVLSRAFSLALFLCTVLIVVMIFAGAFAHGQVLPLRSVRPEMIVFTAPGCAPCNDLQNRGQDALAGFEVRFVRHGTAEFDRMLAEFEQCVPLHPERRNLRSGYVGPAEFRPSQYTVPLLWARGSGSFWTGYDHARRKELSQWSERQLRLVSPDPQRQRPAAVFDGASVLQASDAALSPRDDFEGVVLIGVLGDLSDKHQAERAAMARRVDRALQEITAQTLGSKARAYFIARVAEPETYDRIARLTGLDPTAPGYAGPPAALHVLIPERYRGVRGLIERRVSAALQEHFLADLRSARINVIMQRLDGGTYEALVASLVDRTGPADDEGPFEPFVFFASAWLSERSDLARRILQRFNLA